MLRVKLSSDRKSLNNQDNVLPLDVLYVRIVVSIINVAVWGIVIRP
jgi:hypothetical protein